MLRFRADDFADLMGMIRSLRELPSDSSIKDMPEPLRKKLATMAGDLDLILQEIQLPLSHNTALKIVKVLENGELIQGQLKDLINELSGRVSEELQARMIFCLSPETMKYYDPKEDLFGRDVHAAFPSSIFDVTEAGKCLALARPTAAVMHLMRALESPLQAMAAVFSVSSSRDNWHTLLVDIEKAVLALAPKAEADKKEFFSSACAQFRFFKDAWRNSAMHARVKYTDEEADIIFRSVKAFMGQLAKRLKESE